MSVSTWIGARARRLRVMEASSVGIVISHSIGSAGVAHSSGTGAPPEHSASSTVPATPRCAVIVGDGSDTRRDQDHRDEVADDQVDGHTPTRHNRRDYAGAVIPRVEIP